MPTKRWSDFFIYLGRVFILLIILAILLPKLVEVCNSWMSSRLHNEQRPIGNPQRVEAPGWSESVIQLFPLPRKSDNFRE
ncbi:hypothetical protein E4K67_13805 [Desulfosporosinus fructosivorans]|uniref:Uncharacterized protein n=1 Tax=Desulfosporosinus fructosivorans TaxID=2018669 RepID=A0A4Z0R3X1_9FIRM|nr:hypothetical protein E4K67_13805 [Desulfosporosinus fructosivorans]